MGRAHWLATTIFLLVALVVATLRLRRATPPRLELPRCASPRAELEGGRLQVRCGGAARPDPRLPAGARLLLGLRLELNGASESELRALPRIGPVLSRRIVEARREAGGFCRLEELATVRGIGRTTLRRLAPLVSVAPRAGCGGAGSR